ncbi:MAG: hypothetical protein JXA99_13915 [Candidatus Lokiarchaeota archaeon]|nr:hypothetical protein [Candidatus Lokiarchaeota archaeon]
MELLEIKPDKRLIKVIEKEKQTDIICYFFDTDEYASPFDINMAYDAGIDNVLPYSNVKANYVPKLINQLIFSRKICSRTIFFVGGSKTNEADLIAKNIYHSLVAPFNFPIIIDPRGSHTTASAIIATMIKAIKNLKNKNIVILGTGPTARILAILAARLKAKIVMFETLKNVNQNYINDLNFELSEKLAQDFKNLTIYCNSNDIIDRFDLIKNADIICSLVAPGVEILPVHIIKKLKSPKLIIDGNMVPPYGVWGLNPNDNNKEIYPGIFGIGALIIGNLKYKIESLILKEAMKSSIKRIFNYNYAFNIALKLLNLK